MIITYQNREDIQNKIYIHDSYFTNIQHHYISHELTMEMKNDYLKKSFGIIFKKLCFLQMQCFDIWYESDNRILDWELKEDTRHIYNLLAHEQKRAEPTKINTGKTAQLPYMVHSQILLNSGDTIEIICEKIEFTQHSLLEG